MRTTLHDIQQIENYLFRQMNEQALQDFQIRLLTEPHLQQDVERQTEAYALVKAYGRKKLKAELEAVHERLMRQPHQSNFLRMIKHIFNKKP